MSPKILLTMKLYFLILFISIQGFAQIRPKEAWVFRSVLDKRARIITVALNKDLYVAYDGNNCGIFKIWKEGVKFSGTIWDSKHGPQPISNGNSYSNGIVDEPVWFVQKNNQILNSKTKFLGYIWKDNKVTFKYEILCENKSILIEETPEFIKNQNNVNVGLERKFKISDTQGFEVYSLLKYDNLAKIEDIITDGTFKYVSKTEKYLNNNITLFDVKANFYFKSNTNSTITVYYNPSSIK